MSTKQEVDYLYKIWNDPKRGFVGPEKFYQFVKDEGKYKIGRASITIKASEDDPNPVLFPVPSAEEFTLSDLRSAFPAATSMRYRDEEGGHFHHVLCRNETFLQPHDGWFKENRVYIVVTGVSNTGFQLVWILELPMRNCILKCAHTALKILGKSTTRYDRFQAFRRQLHGSNTSTPFNSNEASTSTSRRAISLVNVRVGHGIFRNDKFCKLSSTSAFGGLVVVGPYSREEKNSEQIRKDAYEKFCSINRLFRQKYKSSDCFILVYTDGSPVNLLPDKSTDFTIGGYRDFLDAKMKFDRLRLYICEKLNFEQNNEEVEIGSASSSDESLPDLFPDRDKTLPYNKEDDFVLQIKFNIRGEVYKQSFPNNAQSDALFDYISGLPLAASNFSLSYNEDVIHRNRRLLDIFGDDAVNICVDVTESEENEIDLIVNATLQQVENIEEPTAVLKKYSDNFMMGRKLDITDPTEPLEGDTVDIFVSRYNIFEDGCSKILSLEKYRYPLCVTFYGEAAEDLGGPRREFFELYLEAFKNNLLHVEGDEIRLKKLTTAIVERKYYSAGIIIGLSAIQDGQCAPYLAALLQHIEDTDECYVQLRTGLDQTGLLKLIQQKPTLKYLFCQGNRATLTVSRLLGLLKPNFSETGSNERLFQDSVYSHFVKYVREVAGGRRNMVTLSNILAFTTGANEEPVLGFSLNPSIEFPESEYSFLPNSNTCINRLNLPRPSASVPLPEAEKLFTLYDYAFLNTYFGMN